MTNAESCVLESWLWTEDEILAESGFFWRDLKHVLKWEDHNRSPKRLPATFPSDPFQPVTAVSSEA